MIDIWLDTPNNYRIVTGEQTLNFLLQCLDLEPSNRPTVIQMLDHVYEGSLHYSINLIAPFNQ